MERVFLHYLEQFVTSEKKQQKSMHSETI